MRYVLDTKQLVNNKSKELLTEALTKQISFITAVKTTTAENTLTLNKPIEENGPTLREIILNIPSKYNENVKIFHSVDKHWNDPLKSTLTHAPGNHAEAIETLDALIPMLHHEHREDIHRFFHHDASHASLQVQWDPNVRTTTLPDDEAFLQCIEEDDEYNLAMIETSGTLEAELNEHTQGIQSHTKVSNQLVSFHLSEEQSILNSTIETGSTSNKTNDSIKTNTSDETSNTNNTKDYSAASIISALECTSDENSMLTSSTQSTGEKSDSSSKGKEKKKKPVSFAPTKEVKLYPIGEGCTL